MTKSPSNGQFLTKHQYRPRQPQHLLLRTPTTSANVRKHWNPLFHLFFTFAPRIYYAMSNPTIEIYSIYLYRVFANYDRNSIIQKADLRYNLVKRESISVTDGGYRYRKHARKPTCAIQQTINFCTNKSECCLPKKNKKCLFEIDTQKVNHHFVFQSNNAVVSSNE